MAGLSLGVRHGEPVLGDVAMLALSLAQRPDGRFEIDASGRPMTITVTAPPALAGSYPVTPSELVAAPVNLQPPLIVAPAEAGAPYALQQGLWLCLGAAAADGFSYQWYADGIAVPEATQTTFSPAPGTQTIAVVETLTVSGFDARSQASTPTPVA